MGKLQPHFRKNLNTFADTLEQIFPTKMLICAFTVSTEQVVNAFLKHPLTVQLRAIHHSEIAWIVCDLKSRKGAGSDEIQNIMLRHLPQLVLKFIVKIRGRSDIKGTSVCYTRCGRGNTCFSNGLYPARRRVGVSAAC
jgi:hypothetical protein